MSISCSPELPVALLNRFGALKRLPAFDGASVASRLFAHVAGHAIACAGENIEPLVDWLIAAAASAAIVGSDPPGFVDLVGESRWRDICRTAADHALADAPPLVREAAHRGFDRWSTYAERMVIPSPAARRWIERLADLPRGGYSSVAAGKCIPLPRETQGEHSIVTAIIAALVARTRGRPAAEPVLMALFHHLSAVLLPVFDHQAEAVVGHRTTAELEQLAIESILHDLPTEFGRAVFRVFASYAASVDHQDPFIIADVLDRALELRHHATLASLTLDRAIRDYQLLGEGSRGHAERQVLEQYGLLNPVSSSVEVR